MNISDVSWSDEDNESVEWDKLDEMTDRQILAHFSAFGRMIFERLGPAALSEISSTLTLMAKMEDNETNQEA